MKKTGTIAILLLLGIGILFIPIGNPEKYRYGPFHSDIMKEYEIEHIRGGTWRLEIFSVTHDTLIEFRKSGGGRGYSMDSIARISLEGTTYYLNSRSQARPGERFATERQKWKGEERWTVGGLLAILVAGALGMLH